MPTKKSTRRRKASTRKPATRKATRRRSVGTVTKKTTRRKRTINRPMKRKSKITDRLLDAAAVGGGVIAGQYLGTMVPVKEPMARNAILVGAGVLLAGFAPGIGTGVAAAGIQGLAAEVLPGLPTNGVAGPVGALTNKERKLIEAAARGDAPTVGAATPMQEGVLTGLYDFGNLT